MTTLGQKVKELRISRGLTQQRLAERGEVNQSLITALESGRRKYVSVQDVEGLALGLDISSDELWSLIPGGKRRERYIALVQAAGREHAEAA